MTHWTIAAWTCRELWRELWDHRERAACHSADVAVEHVEARSDGVAEGLSQ